MIEYWNELTQGSQVAIIIAAIAGIAGVLAALIRSFFKIGIRLVIAGILAGSSLLGFDSFTFNEESPPMNKKTGRERAPLFAMVDKKISGKESGIRKVKNNRKADKNDSGKKGIHKLPFFSR